MDQDINKKAYSSITITDLVDTATYIYYAKEKPIFDKNNDKNITTDPTIDSAFLGIYSGPPLEGGKPEPTNFTETFFNEIKWMENKGKPGQDGVSYSFTISQDPVRKIEDGSFIVSPEEVEINFYKTKGEVLSPIAVKKDLIKAEIIINEKSQAIKADLGSYLNYVGTDSNKLILKIGSFYHDFFENNRIYKSRDSYTEDICLEYCTRKTEVEWNPKYLFQMNEDQTEWIEATWPEWNQQKNKIVKLLIPCRNKPLYYLCYAILLDRSPVSWVQPISYRIITEEKDYKSFYSSLEANIKIYYRTDINSEFIEINSFSFKDSIPEKLLEFNITASNINAAVARSKMIFDKDGLTLINQKDSPALTIYKKEGNENIKTLWAETNGDLYMKGNITATGGAIGGWTLKDNRLLYPCHPEYTAEDWQGVKGGVGIIGSQETETLAFYAGFNEDGVLQWEDESGKRTVCEHPYDHYEQQVCYQDNQYTHTSTKHPKGGQEWWNHCNFYVQKSGRLVARNADIKGNITATGGAIGGWNIKENYLFNYSYTDYHSGGVGLGIGDKYLGTKKDFPSIWAGYNPSAPGKSAAQVYFSKQGAEVGLGKADTRSLSPYDWINNNVEEEDNSYKYFINQDNSPMAKGKNWSDFTNFYVTNEGHLKTVDAQIGGWILKDQKLYSYNSTDLSDKTKDKNNGGVGMASLQGNKNTTYCAFWAGYNPTYEENGVLKTRLNVDLNRSENTIRPSKHPWDVNSYNGKFWYRFSEGDCREVEATYWKKDCAFYVLSDGEIKATKGHIANWEINKSSIVSEGRQVGMKCEIDEDTRWCFWSGDKGSGPSFKVTADGSLLATKADITGIITATGGKIGGFEITSKYLVFKGKDNIKLTFPNETITATLAQEAQGHYWEKTTDKTKKYDIDGDGIITPLDATLILQKSVKLEPDPKNITVLLSQLGLGVYKNGAQQAFLGEQGIQCTNLRCDTLTCTTSLGADYLIDTSVGHAAQAVYFKDGVPKTCQPFYNLGWITKDIPSGDFNDYMTPGVYHVSSSDYPVNISNMPEKSAGKLIVESLNGNLSSTKTWWYIRQTFVPLSGWKFYTRYSSTNGEAVWSIGSWYRFSGTEVK